MADTTSLSDLPISPQTDNNIKFETSNKNQVINNTSKQLSEQREIDDKKSTGILTQQNIASGALPPTGASQSGTSQSGTSQPGTSQPGTSQPGTSQPGTSQPGTSQPHVAAIPPSTSNMNEFVSGIQAAAASGALGLPSRDIPQRQTHITQDEVTKPNYVPTGPDDYIMKHQTQEEIINNHVERANTDANANHIYDELQGPILIGVLYFLFQLPIVKKQMMRILPALFLKDGNLKLSGYIIYSILFSGLYYASTQSINYLSI